MMTKREAARELKRRGWARIKGTRYVPPPKKRGIPKDGVVFVEACSFEAICFASGRQTRASLTSTMGTKS